MTELSSSSESTGPPVASSSSRGALASIAASVILLGCGIRGERTVAYFVALLDSSSGML